ncbi:MAG: lysophospholipid acyltransferase family protein [Christensenellaceae bacterium]
MINLSCIILGAIISIATSYKLDALHLNKIYVPILLWLAFSVAVFVVFAVSLYVYSLLLPKKTPKKPGKLSAFFINVIVKWVCRVSNVKVHVRNGGLIEKDKRYLLVSNHRSMYDPLIQIACFNRCKPILISKPENFKIPLVGPIIRNAGFLAINRDNDREALKTIVKAIDYVKTYDYSVGVCPEGTRNTRSRDLLPLKAGCLKIATKPKIPIAVMTFEGTEKIHKRAPFKRTHVYLDVLKIYTPEEYESLTTTELSDEIAALMQENINKYNAGSNNEKK